MARGHGCGTLKFYRVSYLPKSLSHFVECAGSTTLKRQGGL